jgi:hypothetical protein
VLDQLTLDEILAYQHTEVRRAEADKIPSMADTDENRRLMAEKAEIVRTERYQVCSLAGKEIATASTLLNGLRPGETVAGFGVGDAPERGGVRAYIRIKRPDGYYLSWGNGESVKDAFTSAAINYTSLNIMRDKYRS